MIYLDTHVVLWLYVGERNKLSDFVQSIIAQDFVLVCSSTRDVFDRLIVANAMIDQNILLTKDHKILSNYANAKWND